MKVILLQDIKGVGKKDQVINAADGYAKNFLFPRNLAVEATKGNMANLQAKQNSIQFNKNKEKQEAQNIAEKLKTIELQIKVKAGENGKIFGGVTAKEISESLKSQCKIDVDKKKILLAETIKNIGACSVDIKLYEGVMGKVKVRTIAE